MEIPQKDKKKKKKMSSLAVDKYKSRILEAYESYGQKNKLDKKHSKEFIEGFWTYFNENKKYKTLEHLDQEQFLEIFGQMEKA